MELRQTNNLFPDKGVTVLTAVKTLSCPFDFKIVERMFKPIQTVSAVLDPILPMREPQGGPSSPEEGTIGTMLGQIYPLGNAAN